MLAETTFVWSGGLLVEQHHRTGDGRITTTGWEYHPTVAHPVAQLADGTAQAVVTDGAGGPTALVGTDGSRQGEPHACRCGSVVVTWTPRLDCSMTATASTTRRRPLPAAAAGDGPGTRQLIPVPAPVATVTGAGTHQLTVHPRGDYVVVTRAQAAALVLDSGRTIRDVGRELGVNHETLRNWVDRLRPERDGGRAQRPGR
ncbi:transposase [Micromonospora haikouensis]|uniref:transposase n=1 Tax=Micromonospora haikouensis TaxID=686309 RepID=UPI0036C1981F